MGSTTGGGSICFVRGGSNSAWHVMFPSTFELPHLSTSITPLYRNSSPLSPLRTRIIRLLSYRTLSTFPDLPGCIKLCQMGESGFKLKFFQSCGDL